MQIYEECYSSKVNVSSIQNCKTVTHFDAHPEEVFLILKLICFIPEKKTLKNFTVIFLCATPWPLPWET